MRRHACLCALVLACDVVSRSRNKAGAFLLNMEGRRARTNCGVSCGRAAGAWAIYVGYQRDFAIDVIMVQSLFKIGKLF